MRFSWKFLFLPWVRGRSRARAEVAVSPFIVFFFQRWPRPPHCTCGATGGPLTNVFWLHCRQMTPMCLTGTKKTAFVQALDKSLDLPLAMREPWQPSLWLGHHITGFAASRGRCRGEVAQVRPRWNVPRFSGAGAAAFRLIGSRSICFAIPDVFAVFSATLDTPWFPASPFGVWVTAWWGSDAGWLHMIVTVMMPRNKMRQKSREDGAEGREMSRRRRGFVIRYMMASAVFFGTVTPAKEKNTFGWDSVDETSAVFFFFQLRLFPESLRWPLDIKQTRTHVLIQILREKNASVFEILCAFRVHYEFLCCCFSSNQALFVVPGFV